ncbi:MAG: hypothetical protein AB7O96_02605 [Pseudobdellovibrionaceae bacterium]
MKTALKINVLSFLIFFSTSPALGSQRERALALLKKAYSPHYKVVSTKKNITLLGCKNSTVRIQSPDPVTKRPRNIVLSVFKPAYREAHEAILIVPPTGGENTIDRGYAYLFCQDGYDAVIISTWDQIEDVDMNLKTQDIAVVRAVSAIRTAVDFVKKPTGILATSMGSILTSVTLAVESRFKAAFLIVGGAPISEIMATSQNKKVRVIREARMKAHHFTTADQYRRALKKAMKIDLNSLVQPIAGLKLKMVIATADDTVPTKNQFQLWNSFGRPENIQLKTGHTSAVLKTFSSHSHDVLEFFDRSMR